MINELIESNTAKRRKECVGRGPLISDLSVIAVPLTVALIINVAHHTAKLRTRDLILIHNYIRGRCAGCGIKKIGELSVADRSKERIGLGALSTCCAIIEIPLGICLIVVVAHYVAKPDARIGEGIHNDISRGLTLLGIKKIGNSNVTNWLEDRISLCALVACFAVVNVPMTVGLVVNVAHYIAKLGARVCKGFLDNVNSCGAILRLQKIAEKYVAKRLKQSIRRSSFTTRLAVIHVPMSVGLVVNIAHKRAELCF